MNLKIKSLNFKIVFVTLLFISKIISAQDNFAIDSLNQIIKTSTFDSSIAFAYLALGEQIYLSNLDSTKPLSEKAISIAKKNLSRKNISLKEKNTFKIILSKALNNLGYYYGEKDDLEKQKQLYLEALEIITEAGTKLDIAEALNNVGYLYGQLGDIEKQKNYYFESLKIKQEENDKKGMNISYSNIGHLYYNQGNYPEALNYLFKALKLQEELKDYEGISNSLNSIGYMYGKQENGNKQKEFYIKALTFSTKINDKMGIARTSNNLGTIYKKELQLDTALYYFNNCIKFAEQIGSKKALANAENNIGSIYEQQNEFEKAKEYYSNALATRIEIGDKIGIINSELALANLFFKQNNLPRAQEYAEDALIISKQIGFIDEIKESAEILYKVYKKLGKYQLSLDLHELFIAMRDSSNDAENNKALVKQNLDYEYEKKELKSKLENDKKLAIAQSEKQKQKSIILIVSVGLILALILGLFALNRWRITQKQKILIEEKNNKINLLLGEIHHRVKNNLQVVSSLLSLQERNIKDETAKTAISEGKERVKSMGLIHKMLYQNDNYAGIEMSPFVHELTKGLIESFGLNNIHLNVSMNNIKMDVDTAIPLGLILNELIMNALKYAFKGVDEPELNIKLIEQNQQMILEFSDNGTGKAEDLKDSTHSFGTKLIQSLTRQLNGNLSIVNENGLKITITFASYKLV